MTKRRFLLVSRVGADSTHLQWLATAGERQFDLALSAYDPAVTPPDADGVFFEYRPGRKVAGYAAFLQEHRALWQDYDYIALFDDDLSIDVEGINRLFALAQQYELKLAQPALTHHSYFTYGALLQHPGFQLRYMTYIEMMCPVFRVDALMDILPLFELGYESGIDIIWSKLLGRAPRDMAVIDAVTVDHLRRVGSRKAANGFNDGRRYEDDITALLTRFDTPWSPCVPFEGIRTDGTCVTSRMAFLPDALALIRAIPACSPMKQRARNIAVYWKHLLTAPARIHALHWPHDLAPSEKLDALGREPSAQEIEQA